MRRIMVLLATVAMMAAMLAMSGVAQAAPINDKADAQCLKLAIETLGPGYNPSNYTFHGGTADNDDFSLEPTDGPDVFCGFGGNDFITFLDEGDIFLGGAGNDAALSNRGTFYGGAGNDQVVFNSGTFDGGDGTFDSVIDNRGTISNVELVG